MLMGQAAGAIAEVLPAAVIMDEMVSEAIETMRASVKCIVPRSQLSASPAAARVAVLGRHLHA